MATKKKEAKKQSKKVDFIIDATNVCSWHKININNQSKNMVYTTSLNVILKLTNVLAEQKKTFKCIFDASTPYKLPDEEQEIYRHLLQTFEIAFYQVTGGQRADDWVLALADKFGSKVISTDRFRDFQDRYKWLSKEDSRLIKGGIMDMMDELTMVLPSLKITETIDGTADELFIGLARKMGLEGKLCFKGTGKIKSFNALNEYGFIYSDETEEEVYFKQSEFKIVPDIAVKFDLFRDGSKIFAKNVIPTGVVALDNTKTERSPKNPPQKTETAEVNSQDSTEVLKGEVQWFNSEKGFGLISQLNSSNSFMFKKDNFGDENIEPEPKMQVSFTVQTRNGKSYAFDVKESTENSAPKAAETPKAAEQESQPSSTKQNLRKQDSSDDFKEKVSNILPQLNIRLNGKINNIKGNYGFIGVENTDSALFFQYDDKSGLRAGTKVSFKLDVNDHGVLASDVKIADAKNNKTAIVNKEKHNTEPKVEVEAAPKKAVEAKLPKAKEQDKAEKISEPAKQVQAKKTIKAQAVVAPKIEQLKLNVEEKPKSKPEEKPKVQKTEHKEKVAVVETPKLVETPKVEKVEPVKKVTPETKEPQIRRMSPARAAAENLEKANSLEVLPGEKLSKLAAFESEAPVAKPKPQTPKLTTTAKTVKEEEMPVEKAAPKKEETPQATAETEVVAATTPKKTSTRKKPTAKKPTAKKVEAKPVEAKPVEEVKAADAPVEIAKKPAAKKTTTRKTTARKTSATSKKAIATKPRKKAATTHKTDVKKATEAPSEESAFIVITPDEKKD